MQQVNLYQPILRKQEKVFSAKAMLQGSLLVLAGLCLIYGYTLLQTHNLRQQLQQTREARDQQLQRLTTLIAQYPTKAKDASLPARIDTARLSVQRKQALLAGVKALGLDATTLFSAHLSGLARQDLPDLWLRQISLHYGQQVELQGSALRAEEVPLYVQRLSNEAAFAGTAFQSVVIARNEEQADRIDFTLSTQPPKESNQ